MLVKAFAGVVPLSAPVAATLTYQTAGAKRASSASTASRALFLGRGVLRIVRTLLPVNQRLMDVTKLLVMACSWLLEVADLRYARSARMVSDVDPPRRQNSPRGGGAWKQSTVAQFRSPALQTHRQREPPTGSLWTMRGRRADDPRQ